MGLPIHFVQIVRLLKVGDCFWPGFLRSGFSGESEWSVQYKQYITQPQIGNPALLRSIALVGH